MKSDEGRLIGGWPAALELQYARQQQRTVLIKRRHLGPLCVQKPFYPEGEVVCHTIVLHPPGGIVGGDRLDIEIDLLENSRALLTTPGAGKWYRSGGPGAAQNLVFHVASGAVLEWFPGETILFNGARAHLRTQIHLKEDALFMGWEITCLGRVASGELYQQGLLDQMMDIYKNDASVWHEHGILQGSDPLLHSPIGLAGNTVVGTLWVAGPAVPEPLLDRCRELRPEGCRQARYGITQMPGILLVRYLGHRVEQARQFFEAIWHCLRPVLAGHSACPPRIWKT